MGTAASAGAIANDLVGEANDGKSGGRYPLVESKQSEMGAKRGFHVGLSKKSCASPEGMELPFPIQADLP
jgi:hypothetical protein